MDLVRVGAGATTRRRDLEGLKAFITREQITERPAYGRYEIVKPALASFFGSVNADGAGFLTDRTGNRRFWLAGIKAVNWDYVDAVDVRQVWGEAANAYFSSEPYRLTPDEATMAEDNAAEALAVDPAEGKLI